MNSPDPNINVPTPVEVSVALPPELLSSVAEAIVTARFELTDEALEAKQACHLHFVYAAASGAQPVEIAALVGALALLASHCLDQDSLDARNLASRAVSAWDLLHLGAELLRALGAKQACYLYDVHAAASGASPVAVAALVGALALLASHCLDQDSLDARNLASRAVSAWDLLHLGAELLRAVGGR